MSVELDGLREELAVANRLLAEEHKMASLGRLSAGIVHEINTPIGSIFSNNEVIARSLARVKAMLLEALETGSAPPAKALQSLDVIAGLTEVDKLACERIAGVIRSLKTLARGSTHELRETDVNELIGHTLKLSNAVFRRRVKFEAELGELPEVQCYPGLLGQVLLNLVVNGAQAIECEGTVTVGSSEQDGEVCISVADTGKGIAPADQPKIFEAGFSTKPVGEGAGIGLALSKEIVVDAHHGSIRFDSEPGRGTTFYVRIPVRQPTGGKS